MKCFYRLGSLLIIFLSLFLIESCDYLDVVPEDAPDLEDAFSNRSVTEKFLRTCYSALPDPTDAFYYPTYFTSRDEFDWRGHSHFRVAPSVQISLGLQNSDDPLLNFWSGNNSTRALYIGIRDCNTFLANIDKPRDIAESERARWSAEVIFLKAYYHYFLMSLYGPISIMDQNFPTFESPEKTHLFREPVDSVTNYIVKLLDDAIPALPLSLPDFDSEYGRITKVIALGIKAKVLTLSASPLFNGNEDYAEWIDKRGIQLIPSGYDPKKWERAEIALKEAIEVAHTAGYRPYYFNKFNGGGSTINMNDTLVQLMSIRKSITEDVDKNTSVIWGTQMLSSDKAGVQDMLKVLYPLLHSQDQTSTYVNWASASWHMGSLFYSNNGVPIEEDRFYDYEHRFDLHRMSKEDNHESYIATGETTVNLHLNREPRFYADLGFDRGFFELSTTTDNGGKSFIVLRHRPGEVGDLGLTPGLSSYAPKKIIAFETSASQGNPSLRYTPHIYHFPLLRIEDLYLMYSEVLNEIKSQPNEEVFKWIDLVREHAGLKGVVKSWENASKDPNAPFNKVQMRDIIRRERLIELAFEGQRYWDLRRWRVANKYWSLPPTRWGNTRNAEEFYTPIQYDRAMQISFRDYLFPLSNYDLRVNPNFTQTYGW